MSIPGFQPVLYADMVLIPLSNIPLDESRGSGLGPVKGTAQPRRGVSLEPMVEPSPAEPWVWPTARPHTIEISFDFV